MTPAPPSTTGRQRALPRRARRPLIDISFATCLRVLVAIALVWIWVQLWQWVLLFVLAAFIAVALDPVVQWLETHGLPRRYGAPLVVLAIAVGLIGSVVVSSASLAQDAGVLGNRLREFRNTVAGRIPADLRQAGSSLAPPAEAVAAAAGVLIGGLASVGVALVVATYLLLDGRRTLRWLVAFVPVSSRRRALETAECARKVSAAYIRGNLITSLLAAIFTWIALAAMQVPAALLLALLAGILDLVPIVGFFLSAAPAILLALTVSPAVALGVAAFYVAYNLVENYYIQPKVYGGELELSDLAVITAFLVGGTLGGVLGALVALPVAAVYPSVERIWFDRPGIEDAADEHERIRAEPEH